jgi:ribosome-associated protein
MADRHCEDVRILDVRGLSQVCDYLIIGSGTSDRQMWALAGELEDLGAGHGQKLFRQSADQAHTWVVLDFVDAVVHLFEPGQRAYYDLDGLWSDAESVSWERGQGREARASV